MSRTLRQYFDQKAQLCQPLVGLFNKYSIEGALTGSRLIDAVNAYGEPFAEDMADTIGYPEGEREETVGFILQAAAVLGDKAEEQEEKPQGKPNGKRTNAFVGLQFGEPTQSEPEGTFLGMPKTTGILVTVVVVLLIVFFVVKSKSK